MTGIGPGSGHISFTGQNRVRPVLPGIVRQAAITAPVSIIAAIA